MNREQREELPRALRFLLLLVWFVFVCWLGRYWLDMLVTSVRYWRLVALLSKWVSYTGAPYPFQIVKFYVTTTWISVMLLLIVVPPWLWIRFKARKG